MEQNSTIRSIQIQKKKSAFNFSSQSILKTPHFEVPIINYDQIDNIDNPIQQAIDAKKAQNKINNPVSHLIKDFDDNRDCDLQPFVIQNLTTPWMKLSQLICSPLRRIGDFKQYLEQKILIEEKLVKYPFRDLQLREQIKQKRKDEQQMKKKVNRKYKSTKNVRTKAGIMISNDFNNSQIKDKKLVKRQSIINLGQIINHEKLLQLGNVSLKKLKYESKLDLIKEHQLDDSFNSEEQQKQERQSFIERVMKNETTVKIFDKRVFQKKIIEPLRIIDPSKISYINLFRHSQTPKIQDQSQTSDNQLPLLKDQFQQNQVQQNSVKSSFIRFSTKTSTDMHGQFKPKIVKMETTINEVLPQMMGKSRNQYQMNNLRNIKTLVPHPDKRENTDTIEFIESNSIKVEKRSRNISQLPISKTEHSGYYQSWQTIQNNYETQNPLLENQQELKTNALFDLIIQRKQEMRKTQAVNIKTTAPKIFISDPIKHLNFQKSRGSILAGINFDNIDQSRQANKSQELDLYEILIPKDNDWDIMNELGNLNSLHFINLNKSEQPHHLRYFNMVKRCEESEYLIKEIEDFCASHNVFLKSPANIDIFLQQANLYTLQRGKAAHLLFNDIENDLIEKNRFLKQQSSSLDNMTSLFSGIIAKINILHHASKLFKSTEQENLQRNQNSDYDRDPMLSYGRNELRSPLMQEQSKIVYLGGVLRKAEQMSFKKLLFRATRGKALTQFFNLEISDQDRKVNIENQEQKFVYLIMFEDGGYIRDRINRICQSTQEPVFEVNKQEARAQLLNLEKQKEDAKNYIIQTQIQIRQYLIEINKMSGGDYSLLEIYKWFILKEKSIYIELNKLKFSEKILMGLLWCPTKYRQDLEEKLDDIRNKRNIEGPQMHLIKDYDQSSFQRPTFIETNEFTWPFQEIVNTYGIPQYQEVNPALFTIVTFPFLFGVMFGDILHGAILFIFSSWLCLTKFKEGSLMMQFHKVRYLLLLMGMCSTYCGFIYNDFTSIPLNLFGRSCYSLDHSAKNVTLQQDCIYPIGVDPSWFLAKNELSFMNSLKMKISVILGVAQMSLGVFMKAFNSLYFKRFIDFNFEFLPQIILLWVLFGFMDIMIIIKWLTDFEQIQDAKPPGIITQMIVMFLNFGDQNEGPMKETQLFSYQPLIMKCLLIIAVITVPLMLLVKPIYEHKQNQKRHSLKKRTVQEHEGQEKQYNAINDEPQIEDNNKIRHSQVDIKSVDSGSSHDHHKVHAFSDLFIHQLIETIEFVLGTVSNTASYLRLWALSLAHSQLAKVFFDNTVKVSLQSNSFIQVILHAINFIVLCCFLYLFSFYCICIADDGSYGSISTYFEIALG